MELAAESARHMASSAGLIVLLSRRARPPRRLARRRVLRPSSPGWWSASESPSRRPGRLRTSASVSTTFRTWRHALSSGDLSFDKVRAVVDAATPESDGELRDQAMEHSVRELVQLARSRKGSSAETARADHDGRSLRFNESFRTVTAQLPAETFAEVRGTLEAQAREIPSDGETPGTNGSATPSSASSVPPGSPVAAATPFTVVAHVPLETLLDENSELSGELERDGLISADTVRRLACDATVILAVDDDDGHTMYEGRQHRYPTDDAAPGTHAARPPLPLPRLRQRHLRERSPHPMVETSPRYHGLAKSGAALRAPPPPGALKAVDGVGKRQRGAHVHRPDGPGHDVAPFAPLDDRVPATPPPAPEAG